VPEAVLGWVLLITLSTNASDASFLRLTPLPAPKIVVSAEEYPGDGFPVKNLVDGNTKTEFSSNGKGTNTFVEFDFGSPVRIGGFRHQDRNDPATIAGSELTFSDSEGNVVATVPVEHVNRRGGVTSFALPEPVTAQRVRWRVSQLGSPHGTVGGAELALLAAGEPEPTPRGIAFETRAVPVIDRQAGSFVQPLILTLDYPYANPADVVVRVEGQSPKPMKLALGRHTLEFTMPATSTERTLRVVVDFTGQTIAEQSLKLKPARRLTVYILPHSHTDIGYTEIQTEIEDKQVNNLLLGMQYARETAGNPPGARFIWNVEVLWAADLFLNRLGSAERAAFLDAVRKGQVALCGMYLNELTGLCRPEELVRLFRFATELRAQTGATIDSAMISDVPGYTWGTVPAMTQAGIKYFSVAPNYFDRIGDILVQWENKPFWWVGPDGQSKVLVWIPFWGYAMSHRYGTMSPQLVEDFCAGLEQRGYPYDIAYVRWSGHGDNAAPDPAICNFVKTWNADHAWPQFVIASASEAFQAFEKRYGDQLPVARGDWTPYWEDGAGSSALETALNRASSDRLAQAETLWAMQGAARYPTADFRDAWNEVLLYSEHTWGAWCSVGEPARRETREQWAVKQSYAVAADRQSRDLLSRALGRDQQAGDESAIDVFNTASWARSELVTVPKYLSENRSTVLSADGQVLPTQRLRNGELVLRTPSIPPLAAQRYQLASASEVSGKPAPLSEKSAAKASGAVLENDQLLLRLDETTGGIVELRLRGLDANLADTDSGHALNDYLYLIGDNPADLQRNGPVKIRVGEPGPLIASLIVESEAPGCFRLTRELRLVAGADYVEIINVVDKKRLEAKSYHAKEGKESVNFAFPFRVPDGEVRLDVPFGVIRPDLDQIPSACKNWFTVGRWADVANAQFGVTWVTLDAPLVQVGGVTATLLNSQTNPDVWRKKVGPTQRLYSWAMNNHWGTNYRAYQEGPTVFRFILRPHRGPTDPAEATRFATAFSQPLLVTGARGREPRTEPLFRVSPTDVVITGLKPSDDGRALIVRLWNASAREQSATLDWVVRQPKSVRLTDTSEHAGEKVRGPIVLPPSGLTALRVELK
jgi:hypothetical protein